MLREHKCKHCPNVFQNCNKLKAHRARITKNSIITLGDSGSEEEDEDVLKIEGGESHETIKTAENMEQIKCHNRVKRTNKKMEANNASHKCLVEREESDMICWMCNQLLPMASGNTSIPVNI